MIIARDTERPIRSVLLLMVMAACPSADAGSVPTVGVILTRMEAARVENRARFRSYEVTREYKLFGKEKHKPKSQIIAAVTFVPPNSKKYVIQQSFGAAALGERIVRQMLDGEAEAVKDYADTDVSAANYDFRFLRVEKLNGRDCYVLDQIPRRKEKNLLHGMIWVDAETYRLHRFMGQPAKSPSWWLRDPRIEFSYGEVEGMWLQTSSQSSANVRIFGPYTMVSRDLEYYTGAGVTALEASPADAFAVPSSR